MTFSRRQFGFTALTALAFTGFAARASAIGPEDTYRNEVTAFGPLERDPNGLLDLPRGFSYRIVSEAGETMDDGFLTPDNFDGMGCFPAGNGKVALVRNHELSNRKPEKSATGGRADLEQRMASLPHFATTPDGKVLAGGTSTLVVDLATGKREAQFLSLAGTATNCAGGTTPWGSWLTCEESVLAAPDSSRSHGWLFEVPAAGKGLVTPQPLKAMGRFRHEAAAVDPVTGIVYMTEDREDGLFYRFIPNRPGALAAGGRLQALAFVGIDRPADSRNWNGRALAVGRKLPVRWIDLDDVESPADDLRTRGHAMGAVVFARGEGVHLASGRNGFREFYFTCTSGGAAKIGQIMRHVPDRRNASGGTLELFLESSDSKVLDYADNITVSPYGHLIVCEDRTGNAINHLRGVTPRGKVYALARLTADTELAGACFSPDGSTMFLNVYSPGKTLAIRGPWERFVAS